MARSGRRHVLKEGDLIALVATVADDTPDADKNRILGMIEPSTIAAHTADFPLPWGHDHRAFNPDGSYRWPFALINKRAWTSDPDLFLADVAPRPGNPFGSVAAAGVVELRQEEADRILAHPHHPVRLIRSSNPALPSPFEEPPRGKGAPPPAEAVRRGVMHMRDDPAELYWFHLERNDKPVAHKAWLGFDPERNAGLRTGIRLEELITQAS